VFFGTSEFAVPSLVALASRAVVTLVVTQPDRPSGRGRRLKPTPVKSTAALLRIPTLEPERLRDVAPLLAAERADLFVVASYGKIVPASVLEVPRLGALNVHPSLLPLYRGATPLQSAIRDGRAESGVTIILMDAGMDTGDIVLQERTPVGPRETYGELHDRYARLGAELLAGAVERAVAGTLERVPQAAFALSSAEVAATLTHPLTKDDLAVEWTWKAQRIVDAVRSLSPQPLARACVGAETVKIVSAHVAGADERSDLARIACADGAVILEQVVPPNRGAMSGAAYLRTRATA
jgi:methionyl-tRNA formyltransferase